MVVIILIIHTKRLDIKEMVYADYKDYFAYASNTTVANLAGFKPVPDIETAKNLVMGSVYRGDTYSIFLNESNIYIGTCNIYNHSIRKLKGVYTLGISLAQKYWGFGFGKETITALIKYAFKYKNAQILEMAAITSNLRSRKMIESLGFSLDGMFKKYSKSYDNTIYDVAIYSLTKEDYEEIENGKNIG